MFAVTTAATAMADQVPDFSVSADLRLRHESIRREADTDNERQRYRGRVSFSASTPGDLEWELRVATGNGDPVSTNLDFGRGFRVENVRLDRLWVRWAASDSVHVDVGKMKNPLRRGGDSNLIWDSDLNPRGIATSISAGPWFAVAGAFQMADSDRDLLAPLAAFQGGVRLEPAGAGTFRAGLGYLAYGGIRGHPPLYDDRFDGNSVDADGNHRFDYDIVTLMADYEFDARGIPLQLFTESAMNTAAGSANRAFLVGIRAGGTDESGKGQISWTWRDTEADSLVAVFTDSDFAGGETDSRGHTVNLQFALSTHVVLGGTFIRSKTAVGSAAPRQYDRVMLDMEFRF
jgi:hypothetical protein